MMVAEISPKSALNSSFSRLSHTAEIRSPGWRRATVDAGDYDDYDDSCCDDDAGDYDDYDDSCCDDDDDDGDYDDYDDSCCDDDDDGDHDDYDDSCCDDDDDEILNPPYYFNISLQQMTIWIIIRCLFASNTWQMLFRINIILQTKDEKCRV